MSELNEVIAKSVELNNAIKKLNEETKVINSIVTEKRNAKKEDIMNDLQKYIDIMAMLDIDVIEFKTKSFMHYYELDRRLGIRIRRRKHGNQIDLGCCSNVMSGFYAYHSIGRSAQWEDEEIMNGFCEQWNDIRKNIDSFFSEAVEAILTARKEKAIKERECAIKNLTAISQ